MQYANFLQQIHSDDPKVIVKLDLKDAFSSIRCDHVLQTCMDYTPVIAKLAFLVYRIRSSVMASGHSTTSSSGVQHGDSIDPLLLALAVDQRASGVESKLNVLYLNDTTISSSHELVHRDVQRCIMGLKRIGLKVNLKKTKIINVGLAAGNFSCVIGNFSILLRELKVTQLTKMEFVRSSILNDATRGCIMKKVSKCKMIYII